MTLVGDVVDPIKLLQATRETPIDVIIVSPLNTDGEPKICSHLLAEHPRLKVITLSSKGEAAFLYQNGIPCLRIDEPSGQTLLEAIRGALKHDGNK